MIKNKLNDKYFEWMHSLIKFKGREHYKKLLQFLHNFDFTYLLDMDGNRYEDGIELRYRFGYECGIEPSEIALFLDNRECSVLEMMVALSIRLEEHIMDDPDIGNRTGKWFWSMIDNLGLSGMSDDIFNNVEANNIIDCFLKRRYEANGKGGLFYIPNCVENLRKVEIWYQACWYLDCVIGNGD